MTDGKLNRRDFLKVLGAGAALPSIHGASSLVAPLTPFASFGSMVAPASLRSASTEAALIQSIRDALEPMFKGYEMALTFRRYDDDGTKNFEIAINDQKLYPVASAFKYALVLYYFLNVPRDQWKVTPDDSVYRVAVFSNNGETGRLLFDMDKVVPGDGNMIEKFNDFCLSEIGLQNGINSWEWPNTPTIGFYDDRFAPGPNRMAEAYKQEAAIGNLSSASDLAHGWEYLARAEQNPRWSEPDFQAAIQITRELLAITAPGYLSPIETVLSSGYIGKDGTLPYGEIKLGRVIDDAGLVRVPTGQFLISFMSTSENESVTRPALQKVVDSMRQYEAQMHPTGTEFITAVSAPVYADRYNYGFVRRQELQLFSAPNADAPPVDNPVRRNTVFGMMYLMQGALVRFFPVDSEWGRIIRDDEIDETFSFPDWTAGFADANWMQSRPAAVFVRLEDLVVINDDHTDKVGFLTGQADTTDKFIILNVPGRELTLFEGADAVFKTPVVLNLGATPRGRLYVHRVYETRNMPHYPSVPYTNFLHDGTNLDTGGYAIHGAPWHRWSETITKRETIRRYSHGCINLPNWTLKIDKYNLPVDEFIFRWIGGFPNPGTDLLYLPKTPVVRVYAHNLVHQDVFKYPAPDSLKFIHKDWNDVLAALDAKQIDAPASFFEPTLL